MTQTLPLADTTGVATPPRGLHRVLGMAFGLAIAVGATVGGGIVRTPGEVAAALPNAALFIAAWVFGGVNALLGANIFSELGAMMPRAGGPFVYARRAFGDGVAFFVGYADWLAWCLGAVALTMIVGEYMGALFPPLAGHAIAVDFLTLASIVAIQWLGVRSSGRTQEITTVLKAVALLVLVVAAFVLPRPEVVAPPVAAPQGIALVLAFAVAMQGVIFTYESYYAVIYCGEEMRDPGREIPRSMFRAVFLIIAIYLLVNLACLAVLPIGRIAGDPFVGGTVARVLFGSAGDTIIRLIMIVSVVGTINAILMALSRVLLAMGRSGLFPRQAALVNEGGTPYAALAVSAIVIAIFLATGSFAAVLGLSALFIVVKYTACFTALFALRRREPDTPRPYRARGYPLLPALALAVALALMVALVASDLRASAMVLALLVVSWPLSYLVRRATRTEAPPAVPPAE
ncbi:MAG TPA: APC family permease [Gemmatimonadaceae bacterium]|nr:APC family permease [Gemmatimonadaceae bacterium]